MLEDEWTEVQKRFGLPSFADLDKEFDMLHADAEYPLQGVRKQMQEKIEALTEILADILQPSPESLSQMHECQYVTDEDKFEVLGVYKRLNYLLRAIHESQIKHRQESTAEVVALISKDWPALRDRALPTIKKIKDSWKHDIETKQIIGYFG